MNGFDKLQDVKLTRERASKMLEKMKNDTSLRMEESSSNPNTAVAIYCYNDRSFQRKFFEQHGFLIMKDFVDMETVSLMKDQMNQLVDSFWSVKFEDDQDNFGAIRDEAAVFRTDEKQQNAQGSNAYFLESANKIHFFAENDAMSDIAKGCLKKKYKGKGNKAAALNKCGHGLHLHPFLGSTATPNKNITNIFHTYATSSKIGELVIDTLGYVNPVIPQSMYIFKQPFVGSEVTSHQDSTFLFTEPKQTCLGLWLALDHSTIENGCLWVRPGSQTEPLRRRFIRNPEYFAAKKEQKCDKPLMIFQDLVEKDGNVAVPWEGSLPNVSSMFDVGFVPVECNEGDLLVFGGLLDHLSLANYSSKQRHTFQLHLIEGASTKWAESNWLQYPNNNPFLGVKSVN